MTGPPIQQRETITIVHKILTAGRARHDIATIKQSSVWHRPCQTVMVASVFIDPTADGSGSQIALEVSISD